MTLPFFKRKGRPESQQTPDHLSLSIARAKIAKGFLCYLIKRARFGAVLHEVLPGELAVGLAGIPACWRAPAGPCARHARCARPDKQMSSFISSRV